MAKKLDKYREWLLGVVIEYGVGNKLPAGVNSIEYDNYFQRAYSYCHIDGVTITNKEGLYQMGWYVITPSAVKYLERHNEHTV